MAAAAGLGPLVTSTPASTGFWTGDRVTGERLLGSSSRPCLPTDARSRGGPWHT